MGAKNYLSVGRGSDCINRSHLVGDFPTASKRWTLLAAGALLLGSASVAIAPASALAGTARPSVMKTCPSAAAVSGAAGTSLPAPKVSKSSGIVLCSYNNSKTYANLVIDFSSSKSISPKLLKALQQKMAASQKTTLKSVSGYGSAAYYYTDSYESANGIPMTSFAMIASPELVDIDLNGTIAHVKAVARLVLKG